MRLNCFRGVDQATLCEEALESPRSPRSPRDRPSNGSSKRHAQIVRRHGSSDSRSSTASSSNDSISRLPPCNRLSIEQLEAMMMPVPVEPRPSRCLRLSQPKTYSDIISSMKTEKGCRDWRNFAVFCNDEIDDSIDVNEIAAKKAADCRRKCKRYGSTSSIDEVDMIG